MADIFEIHLGLDGFSLKLLFIIDN